MSRFNTRALTLVAALAFNLLGCGGVVEDSEQAEATAEMATEQGEAMLGAMRDLLKTMPEEVFDNSSVMYTRKHWEDWLAKASAKKAVTAKDK